MEVILDKLFPCFYGMHENELDKYINVYLKVMSTSL